MSTPQENLMDWLRDAHAMEQQAEQMLAATAGRIQNYPEVKARIDLHLEETKTQTQRLRQAIEARGGDTSVMKDMAGKMAAGVQAMGAAMAEDEIVKLVLASYHFEHLEIASYRCLVAGAETLGDTELANICKSSLVEEEAMAAWLADWIPVITRQYLARSASDVQAKR